MHIDTWVFIAIGALVMWMAKSIENRFSEIESRLSKIEDRVGIDPTDW
ncbi:MAG: hypothetical protein Q8J99_00665 [Sulfuritalea sp.]|nr:hypothetical protein [Sulfuritalea sp.]